MKIHKKLKANGFINIFDSYVETQQRPIEFTVFINENERFSFHSLSYWSAKYCDCYRRGKLWRLRKFLNYFATSSNFYVEISSK